MNRHTVEQARQNKPSLIATDLAQFVPRDKVYSVLLNRGVFKWLAVRRDLIRLKNTWKGVIRDSLAGIHEAKQGGDREKLLYLRGYLKGYEECRRDIRKLCHSDRWQAPDHDRKAQEFLWGLEEMP